MNNQIFEKLKNELSRELPGKSHQQKMAPESRVILEKPMTSLSKKSSILIPIYVKNDEFYTVLFQRNDYKGVHSGQICFPGGKKEPGDKSLMETAIRETWEEVGIEKDTVEILGGLTPLHIPVSDFLVYPFVAYLTKIPNFIIDPNEVKQLLIVPVNDLLNIDHVKKKATILRGQQFNIPFYAINNFEIWGATAMIISELTEVLRRISFPHTN